MRVRRLTITNFRSAARGGFVDVEGANPADLDGADVCRALPVVFLGWYDRKNDDFVGQSQYLVPFHRLGTGSINTLVFAPLTHIADLRGAASVIFAMEEPEIALPPHSQRRITRYLRKRMGQAIITSHSPYVIEEFQLSEILAIRRDGGQLAGNFVPTDGLRSRTLKRQRRQLAEAVLARGVIVAEGATECSALSAESFALEGFRADGSYAPFDPDRRVAIRCGWMPRGPKMGSILLNLGQEEFCALRSSARRVVGGGKREAR